MSTKGRALRWIAVGLLCCSGCAAPLWPGWAGRRPEHVDAADTDRLSSAADRASTVTARDGALASASAQEAARELGLPEPEAARLAEIFLGAYAEMYRQAAQDEPRPAAPTTSASAAARETPAADDATARRRIHPASLASAETAPPSVSRRRLPGPSDVNAASAQEVRRAGAQPTPRTVDPAGLPAPTAQLVQYEQPLDAADTEEVPDRSVGGSAAADGPQGPWTRHVRLAIQRLRDELARDDLDAEQRAHGQVCLSLLSLAAEDPEQALEGLQDLDDQQLEFWRQTVMGMGVLLDPEELPKLRQRVALATQHLQDGLAALATLGPLQLRNVTLCTKVNGFGDFVECSGYGLEPGKPVLLYVEVENFTSDVVPATSADDTWARSSARRDARGAADAPRYATELHAHYEILDAQQRTIVSRALPVGGDVCRNRRRDYYISYVLYLPEQIAPGAYTLELTVEDKKGGKFGNAVVGFQIRPR